LVGGQVFLESILTVFSHRAATVGATGSTYVLVNDTAACTMHDLEP